MIWGIIFILFSALIFILSVMAIMNGHKKLKISRDFTQNKKIKTGFRIAAAIHMWAGILVVLSYLLVAVFFIAGITK